MVVCVVWFGEVWFGEVWCEWVREGGEDAVHLCGVVVCEVRCGVVWRGVSGEVESEDPRKTEKRELQRRGRIKSAAASPSQQRVTSHFKPMKRGLAYHEDHAARINDGERDGDHVTVLAVQPLEVA